MGEIISFRTARTPKTLEDVLIEAANAHIIIPRLRAEAIKSYPQDHPMLPYLIGCFDELESYINNSTRLMDDLEDDRVYFAITGCQSLKEMKRRHTRLGERIAVAELTGNVVSFLKYRQTHEPPKGAA